MGRSVCAYVCVYAGMCVFVCARACEASLCGLLLGSDACSAQHSQ